MKHASSTAARTALSAGRFETARRLATAALATNADDAELPLLLHDALAHLGDLPGAIAALGTADTRFEAAIRRLDDLFRASGYHGFYRNSAEAARGLSYEEFLAERHQQRAAAAATVLAQITTQSEADRARSVLQRAAADHERRAPSDVPTLAELDRRWPALTTSVPAPALIAVNVRGHIAGAAGLVGTVTLGIESHPRRIDPLTVNSQVIGIDGETCGDLATFSAPLAADGSFCITGMAAPGIGFIALSSSTWQGLPTRFLARDLRLDGRPLTDLALSCGPWSSAPAAIHSDTLPDVVTHAGRRWHKQAREVLTNPFFHDFPRQDLRLAWPLPPAGVQAVAWCGEAMLPHQVDRGGAVVVFASAAQRSTTQIGWYFSAQDAWQETSTSLLTIAADGHSAVLDTGRSAFHIPWGGAAIGAPPLLAVQGPDRVWRGQGRWQLAQHQPPQQAVTVTSDGALECVIEIVYRFTTGERCTFVLTAHTGEEYLLVEERGEALPGVTFVFGLEDFRGGRGYLHWGAEGESPHWHDLIDADRELARLQESVPWWVPPAGFAWAASFDGLQQHDQISVFTRRRGDWIDHAFAAIAKGPPSGETELDWPFPEMVGSTISMISVASTADGRLEMRFPRFAGERHWGLLASDFARGDGPLKELQQVRHKTSFPRLDQLRQWHLDEPDTEPRPCLVAEHDQLTQLRSKLTQPDFSELWQALQTDNRYGDNQALRFALSGDPATGWRLGRRLVGLVPAQARCLLLSRENGDVWSPVGGRVWAPQALIFDAVVASGVFTEAEEREVRAGLLLAGHMFHSPDLMNWRYGGRNANFEADRVEVVGTIGLCFPHNPDAQAMVAHTIERMDAALGAYCVPGSGKWYENPACYYQHGMKCRMAIASHLAARGQLDIAAVPRMADYMGWLLKTLTPRLPASYALMRDGCSHAEYAQHTLVRRSAPIGDHAHLGPWIPDMAAVVAKWLRQAQPALANALRWAWHEGGRNGGYFGAPGQLLVQSEAADLANENDVPELLSQRLPGFGAVFRGAVGSDHEFMLLAKLGPGGYRYHRSEGSFILIADGRPLVYDGGEAGEAWRHSTITYHEARLPPSAGRIERFASLPSLDYTQGVHPIVLQPGDPIYLSDSCEHQLVDEAWRRARISQPAAARAWLWVKDEYVVVWDRLDVADDVVHRWNLQVMAEAETGDLPSGLRFNGRFGTDLQVLLPAGGDCAWKVNHVPMVEYHLPPEQCVAQRHLEVTSRGAGDWLAVLRPLAPGRALIASTPLQAMGRCVGAHITGPGIDDRVVMGRMTCVVSDDAWEFSGCAGAYLRRDDGVRLILLGAGRIRVGEMVLESSGPAAELQVIDGVAELRKDGEGEVVSMIGEVLVAVSEAPTGRTIVA